jgi:hypothetical protein
MYKKQSIVIKNFKHFTDLRFFVIQSINKMIFKPLLVKVLGLLEIVWQISLFAVIH